MPPVSVCYTPLSRHANLGAAKKKEKIEPRWDRTTDPLVKSQLLYRLSYRPKYLSMNHLPQSVEQLEKLHSALPTELSAQVSFYEPSTSVGRAT